jgi:hypothetical protein
MDNNPLHFKSVEIATHSQNNFMADSSLRLYYFCNLMFLRILDTPLLDVLLIVLALRLFFPSLFGIKSKAKQQVEKDRLIVRNQTASKKSNESEKQGQYIEYEEIK